MLRLLLDFVKLNFIELHAEPPQCFFFPFKIHGFNFSPMQFIKVDVHGGMMVHVYMSVAVCNVHCM